MLSAQLFVIAWKVNQEDHKVYFITGWSNNFGICLRVKSGRIFWVEFFKEVSLIEVIFL